MDVELKERWVTALRSGQYKQGIGVLREVEGGQYTNGYCCLGVLADIIEPAGWNEIYPKDVYARIPIHSIADQQSNAWLRNDILEHRTQEQLATMNDGSCDFLEIADWIKENL